MKYRTIETQIPWKYKWKAIDPTGFIYIFTYKPIYKNLYFWGITKGNYMRIGEGPKPKDWTKTLVKL